MKKLFYLLIIFSITFSFSQEDVFTIKNLQINNEHPHFGLMLLQDNRIIFTSYLLTNKGRVKNQGGNPILTIFEGTISSMGEIEQINPIQIDPKEDISNITSTTMSRDGKQLYLTTNYNSKDKHKGNFKDTNFHIEVGEFVDGLGWTNFKVLSFCDPKYSYGHPALSYDGKAMYFIANIRGGKETTKGGSDIFRVKILGDDIYSEPENLGSLVNSYGREMFPFMAADHTLYFASNRPNGFGGFDVYKSTMNKDGSFNKAEKMPEAINSNQDDFCFVINSENTSGYFSSKRTEGKGDDDIYYFTLKQ